MTASKNKYLVLLTAIICAAMLCCSVYFAYSDIETHAMDTASGNETVVKIGEIYKGVDTLNNTKHFTGENLSKLYAAITGNANATINDVNNKISSSGQITSADIRAVGGKDIALTFGEMEWTVTHLTKDTSGNTIATLWLASSTDAHQWNTWSENVTNVTYPSNVYGTSYIRTSALNSGSDYVATQGATSLTPSPQSASHKYAKFTMPTVSGALTDFIVKPSAVSYQSNQNQNVGGTIGNLGYTLPNEAYGTPSGTINWFSNGTTVDMSIMPTKIGYSVWKDDYIWLPSVTETGRDETINGIWALSNNQRSNVGESWLRSSSSGADGAYYLLKAGSSISSYSAVTTGYAVRPALHLNLTEVNKATVYKLPTAEVGYDGTTHSIQSLLTDNGLYYPVMQLDSASQLSAVNADTYKAKVTLPAPLKWAIDDGSGGWTTVAGSSAQDIEWKIKPRQLTITWSGISSSYVWRSDLLADLQKYKPVIGNGMTIDDLDVILTYDGSANNSKLDTSGAHKIKADIVTNNTASGAAALLKQNYIMPLASAMEYTYTVKKAEQLAPILSIDYENEILIPTNPTVNGQDRRPWLQYKDDSGNWQAVVDMKISDAIMVGGAVSFRYKVPASHTDYIEDSGEYSLIIPKRQTASDMSIDYEKESVSIGGGYSYYIGTSAPADNDSYNVAGTAVSLDLGSGGYIAEQGQTENKIYYYVSAIAGTAFRSDIEELLIPARRAAPELGIDYKTEKTTQALTSKMMYTITGFDAPVKGNGNLVDLNPDRTSKTLRVWYAADASAFKSKEAVITIPARPAAPVIEYDIDSEEYLNGNAPTDKMEYRASTSTLWDKADENTKPKRGMYVFRYTAVEEDKDNGITGAFASVESVVIDYGNKTLTVEVRWTDASGTEFLSAYEYSGEVIKPTAVFYTTGAGGERVPVPSGLIKYAIFNSAGRAESNPTNADTYKVSVSILDTTGQADLGYTIVNPDYEYTIAKRRVEVPILSREAVYNGEEQDIRQCLSNYDAKYTDAAGYMARNVSIDGYVLNLVLKNSNYEWADGRQENYVNIEWNITPLERAVIWGKRSFTYDGSVKHPVATIAGCNGEQVAFVYTGDSNASKVHKGYSITAAISRDDPNYLNYTLTAGSESVTFDIVLGVGMTLIFIEWTDSEGNAFTDGGSFKYSGEVQHPKAVVRKDSADGEILTDIEIEYVDADGNPITSEWTGSYSVRIKVDNTLYGIDGECLESVSYNIIVDDNGDGEYKIIRIEIGGNYKSSYTVGEQFNATGMVVYGVYPDGERTEINVNDYTYAPKEALTEGDNTITVSYGDLSASFIVRAGSTSGPMGGDFDGSKFVSKKMFAICMSGVAALITVCVLLVCVVIHLARRIPKRSDSAGEEESE